MSTHGMSLNEFSEVVQGMSDAHLRARWNWLQQVPPNEEVLLAEGVTVEHGLPIIEAEVTYRRSINPSFWD